MHRRRYASYISTLRKLKDEPIDYTRLVPTAVYQAEGNNKNLIGDININITLPDGFVAQNGPAPETAEQAADRAYQINDVLSGVVSSGYIDGNDRLMFGVDRDHFNLPNPSEASPVDRDLFDYYDNEGVQVARTPTPGEIGEDDNEYMMNLTDSDSDSEMSGIVARPNTPTSNVTYLQGVSVDTIQPSDYFDTSNF
jgi:hypothetical protein